MSLNTLARSMELQIVNNTNGWGQDILYTYRKTNTTTTPIKAFCQEGDYMKSNEDNDIIEDTMSFLSVELSIKPIRGDKISFGGSTWYVERMTGLNPYDIMCVANQQHASGRTGRRTK